MPTTETIKVINRKLMRINIINVSRGVKFSGKTTEGHDFAENSSNGKI